MYSDESHTALYIWNNFFKNTLKLNDFPKDLINSLRRIIDVDRGFSARDIVLGGIGVGPVLDDRRVLSIREFNDVSEKLRIKYPELFAETEFHRVLHYRGRKE